MRRTLSTLLVLAAAVSFMLVGIGPARAVTICDESNGHEINSNVAGNVEVQHVCHINGWTISGSVIVDSGAKLWTRNGTHIGGSISATSPLEIGLEPTTTVTGGLSITGPSPSGTVGGFACGSTIGGSVVLQNLTRGTWIIGEPTGQDPSYYYFGNSSDPDSFCESGNTLRAGVTYQNNHIDRLKLSYNGIAGSVSINSNHPYNEAIKLRKNTIGGSLGCSGNSFQAGSPPTQFPQPVIQNEGEPNNVRGVESGQCAGL